MEIFYTILSSNLIKKNYFYFIYKYSEISCMNDFYHLLSHIIYLIFIFSNTYFFKRFFFYF